MSLPRKRDGAGPALQRGEQRGEASRNGLTAAPREVRVVAGKQVSASATRSSSSASTRRWRRSPTSSRRSCCSSISTVCSTSTATAAPLCEGGSVDRLSRGYAQPRVRATVLSLARGESGLNVSYQAGGDRGRPFIAPTRGDDQCRDDSGGVLLAGTLRGLSLSRFVLVHRPIGFGEDSVVAVGVRIDERSADACRKRELRPVVEFDAGVADDLA